MSTSSYWGNCSLLFQSQQVLPCPPFLRCCVQFAIFLFLCLPRSLYAWLSHTNTHTHTLSLSLSVCVGALDALSQQEADRLYGAAAEELTMYEQAMDNAAQRNAQRAAA